MNIIINTTVTPYGRLALVKPTGALISFEVSQSDFLEVNGIRVGNEYNGTERSKFVLDSMFLQVQVLRNLIAKKQPIEIIQDSEFLILPVLGYHYNGPGATYDKLGAFITSTTITTEK